MRRSLVFLAATCVATAAPLEARAQRPVTVWLEGGAAEHRVSLAGEVEQATGSTLGLAVSLPIGPWLEARVAALGGDLQADWQPSESRSIGQVSLGGVVLPLPWLGLSMTATSRSYKAALGRQRWMSLAVGPEARLPLYGDRIAGSLRLTTLPYVSVSQTASPTRALAALAQVGYTGAKLHASLEYSLERYDFARVADEQRLEQLSMLTVRLGWSPSLF